MANKLNWVMLLSIGLLLTFLDSALSVFGFSLGLPTLVTGVGAILIVIAVIMRLMNKR